MVNTPSAIIKVARPIHWVKNLSLFAALIFTSNLFNDTLFSRVIWAFIAFNFATSATYIFNDIIDAKLDRLHPTKKNRPIASGKLSIPLAYFESGILALLAIFLASKLNPLFYFSVVTYLIIQILYRTALLF